MEEEAVSSAEVRVVNDVRIKFTDHIARLIFPTVACAENSRTLCVQETIDQFDQSAKKIIIR